MKNKFGFILVKSQLGENIGACARSMKNFGFSKLHIVSPKINFPNHKTKATSVGAYDIINKAKVFENVEKAIETFNLVIALSARRRDINKRHISFQSFQNIIKKRKNLNIGLMFGETPIVNQLLPVLSVLSIKTLVVASVPVFNILTL